MFRAEFCIILNRAEEAEAHLRASISIAKKYSLAGYIYADELMQGWVRVLQGEAEAGVRQAEVALEALKVDSFAPIPPAYPDRHRRKSQGGRRRCRGSARSFQLRA